MSAFSATWGAKFLGALVAIGAILGSLAMYGRSKKKEGTSEERLKQKKAADEARKKMDKVPDRTGDDVDDRLSDDTF